MKKYFFYQVFFLILTGFVITFTSCKKEEFSETQSYVNKDTSKWTLEERVTYTTEHFKKIGAIIDKVWKNGSVKNLVIDKLNKKVSNGHQETSLLISDIYDMIQKNNKKIQFDQGTMNELRNELKSFKGIDDGRDVLPQLYFPFYDFSKGRMMKSAQSEDPVFVMGFDPNEPKEFPAYKADANGNLVKQSYTINENEAQNMDNLIVLNINEDMQDPDDGQDSNNDTSVYGDWHKLVMRDLALDRPHESWAKGYSEVTFKAVAIRYGNNYSPQDPNDYNFTIHNILSTRTNYSGCAIGNISHADIRNKTLLRFNQVYTNMFTKFDSNLPQTIFGPYDSNHDEFNDGVCVIMYEYDGWPVSPTNGAVIEPRSYEDYNIQKKKYEGDSRLVYRTADDGAFGQYWILNASVQPLNILYTDENFLFMNGISEIKHDCTSIYQP